MKKKSKWLPRKEYFRRKSAGLLDWQLDKTIPAPTPRKKKIKKLRKRKSRGFTKVKKSKTLRNFTIYVKGEEMEVVAGYSQVVVETAMQKKYHTKNILTVE